MRASGFPYLFPMLLMSVLLFALPLALLLAYSFADGSGASLANYAKFLGDPFNFRVLLNTARLGFETVLATTALGIPIALLYWHSGPRVRHVLVLLTLIPMLTSNVVRTFAWIVILGRQGPISEALVALGLTASPTTLMFTEFGLVLAMTQIELPLIVLPLMAILSRLPRHLSEAAEVAGAGPWRISGDRPPASDAAGPHRRMDPCLREHERLIRHPGRHRGRTKRLRAATHLP